MSDQSTPTPAEGESTGAAGSTPTPVVVNVASPASGARSAVSWVLGTVAVVVLVGVTFVAGIAVGAHHEGKPGHDKRDAVAEMRDRRQAGQDRQADADKLRDWLRERRDEMGGRLRGGQGGSAKSGAVQSDRGQGTTGETAPGAPTDPARS